MTPALAPKECLTRKASWLYKNTWKLSHVLTVYIFFKEEKPMKRN